MINDLRNLHQNGQASVAELRDFLKSLKARNPQEVIGVVSSNLLAQSLVLATFLTAGLLTVFTVGPYLVYGSAGTAPSAKPAPATAAAETPAAASAATAPAPAGSTAATPAADASTSPAGSDLDRAARAMGIDESKPADPGKNPLDKPDLDKLLDGI